MCEEFWSDMDITITDAELQDIAMSEAMAHKAALLLKKTLCQYKLNLVTCESVTSGLIASTMSAVGIGGQYLYGGFIVYDTDAKRRWCGVTTPNLYHKGTAVEMARGALKNSGAMVSLAITGNALPYADSLLCTGIADIAVCIRGHYPTSGKLQKSVEFVTFSIRINVCQDRSDNVCSEWTDKYEFDTTGKVINYPNPNQNHYVNKKIRAMMVEEALVFCANSVKDAFSLKIILEDIPYNKWMSEYTGCGEPSDIIMKHLEGADKIPERIHPKYSSPDMLCHISTSVPSCPKTKRNSN
jgi:nicotinamide mononucleotide (NMN) deamidase PncC